LCRVKPPLWWDGTKEGLTRRRGLAAFWRPMQNFKPRPKEIQELIEAAVCLKDANEELSRAKKASEAAKEKLAKWLKDRHGLSVEELAVGEIVHIEGVALIEVGKMSKFREKEFLMAEPELHAKWTGDIPVRRYKPLV
jgi:hypothetical protein